MGGQTMNDPAAAVKSIDFLVRRDDLRTCKSEASSVAMALAPGQVLLRVDQFAFTSNNVTYGAFGDAMSYWQFFPAGPGQEGWGRIPVWGFGTVIASRHDTVLEGQRFYGYYPMSSHVVLEPARAGKSGFVDGVAHRQGLPAVYNQYLRTTADPGYRADTEAQQMLLRPLFVTSFLIDDFLADNAFFGAPRVILSSASSKTAYGLAHCLSRREQCEVVGLTSPGNAGFLKRLGCYDRVLAYDEVESLDLVPAVFVDMAGNAELRRNLHHHLGEALKYSCSVGGTHWDHLGSGRDLPGPKPILFFAPAQIKKRHAEWGAAELQARIADAWNGFMAPVTNPQHPWMRVVSGRGSAAVEQVYRAMLAGSAPPDEGHVLSLNELAAGHPAGSMSA
jgi:hypothetical protein